jgi:hypothetical protein
MNCTVVKERGVKALHSYDIRGVPLPIYDDCASSHAAQNGINALPSTRLFEAASAFRVI